VCEGLRCVVVVVVVVVENPRDDVCEGLRCVVVVVVVGYLSYMYMYEIRWR
jgi:hypothetical protein